MIPYAVSIKYMIGGYAAILIILFGYLVSLILRWRRLKQDLNLLAEIRQDAK
jgi:hypothetical protein